MYESLKKIIKENERIVYAYDFFKQIYNKYLISDEVYIKKSFKRKLGRDIDLKNPVTFNEKLQWLKINDRNPLYTQLVDKYEVREYIRATIGEEYLVPILGIYESFDEIDFENLPNEFVLKCTHDSGSVIVCKDKEKLDRISARRQLTRCLKRNFYYNGREWPYKNVKPRIICEKMLESDIIDYKIFCFNGEPKFLYVGQGLVSDHSLKIDFYDLEWNKMNISRVDYDNFDEKVEKPEKLDEMIEIAKKLSDGMTFCRIDLYEVDKKIYFAEFTFTPGSGCIKFKSYDQDKMIGDMLRLDNNINK